MIVFPNCKINLGLRILNRREDGFHNLESIFLPVNWRDALEIIEAGELSFQVEGRPIDGNTADNIIVKAYHLLKDKYNLPPLRIVLYKNIPMGAGLGGGSADGAYMLKALNEKFSLGLSSGELKSYALQLGSDCAFFIDNKPSYVTGRGDVMENIELSLKGYCLVVVYPQVVINTAWAFKELATQRKLNPVTYKDLKELKRVIMQPVENWKEELGNDFELVVFKEYPAVEELKNQMYRNGAVYAAMSGSGAAVFGIFNLAENIEKTIFFNNFKDIYKVNLI